MIKTIVITTQRYQMSSVLGDIFQAASKFSGISYDSLSRSTRIASDLRLDGDDVWELLNKINSKYPLNYDGFIFEKYFTDESRINLFSSIFESLFSKREKGNSYEITLGDIESWIMNGYWKEN